MSMAPASSGDFTNSVLPPLRAALADHGSAVLHAPTGSGKTTLVPSGLLKEGFAQRILVVEPRRLAARAAARRIAELTASRLGAEVGFHVRFDRCATARSRCVVITPGILLRYLLDDPYLDGITLVILDEFHERGLECDLALGQLQVLRQTVRPDLKLIVMSATLDVEAISAYLGAAPIISGGSRPFPIAVNYEPKRAAQSWPDAAADAVMRWFPNTMGDVLVFLPGVGEIRRTERALAAFARDVGALLLPLHGDLPAESQDAALQPRPQRKVVLATNVAETSVTVPGVTCVIDTGLARVLRHDPRLGLERLELEPISQAAAEQRAGRAGRTQPGTVVRLWTEGEQRGRPATTPPEVARVDLAGAVLTLMALGETDVATFPWLDPPPPQALDRARALLQELGALADGRLTRLGHAMARLPVQPRLAALLLEACRLGVPREGAWAAALLSERSPFERLGSPPPQSPSDSDLHDQLDMLTGHFRGDATEAPWGRIKPEAAEALAKTQAQFVRLLGEVATLSPSEANPHDAVRRALLAAFPDRLARRREPGGRRGLMVGGRGVRLAHTSAVLRGEFFLCLDIQEGPTESVVQMASAVEKEWLPADRLTTQVDVEWSTEREAVVAWKRRRWLDLVIEELPAALPASDTCADLLLAAARAAPERVRPGPDSAFAATWTRLQCLADWLPEADWPRLDEAWWARLLADLCVGRRSFAEVRQADWQQALLNQLTHAQRQRLERDAPERLAVPSGSKIVLRYERGRPPVLAVRLQELFGLTETPRIAGGRVPVLLHLLAPNYRPQQVTEDLASFWANTYPIVRRELRARYPKHAWPEDPLTAPPQRGPKRRGK